VYFSGFLNINKMAADKKFYRLRVNINGFELNDVKVCLVNEDNSERPLPLAKSEQQGSKLRLKINATRNECIASDETGSTKATRCYTKYYEILSKSNVDESTMRHYLDPKNSLYLIVEFVSNTDENFYINLDDSCDSLVELAAKSLLNIRNIEDLRNAIENPFDSIVDNNLTDVFSPSLIKDINMASLTSFTPIKLGKEAKKVELDINIPYQIQSVSLVNNSCYNNSVKRISNNLKSIENYLDAPEYPSNHLAITCDNLNLLLEANTVKDNVTSLFTKQIKLPKGSVVKKLTYKLDPSTHSLHLEAPYESL